MFFDVWIFHDSNFDPTKIAIIILFNGDVWLNDLNIVGLKFTIVYVLIKLMNKIQKYYCQIMIPKTGVKNHIY